MGATANRGGRPRSPAKARRAALAALAAQVPAMAERLAAGASASQDAHLAAALLVAWAMLENGAMMERLLKPK